MCNGSSYSRERKLTINHSYVCPRHSCLEYNLISHVICNPGPLQVMWNLINPDANNPETAASVHLFTGTEFPEANMLYPVNFFICLSGNLLFCTHTLYTYTVHIHCTHTLYTYNVHIHCTHTLETRLMKFRGTHKATYYV